MDLKEVERIIEGNELVTHDSLIPYYNEKCVMSV